MSKKKKQSTNSGQEPVIGNKSGIKTLTAHSSETIQNFNSRFQLSPTVAYSILAVAVLAAFVGGFSNDYVTWDDPMYVSENKMVQNPTFANLIRLLKVECALNYHPLTMLTLWLNGFLFGKNATSFIVTNTIIHILNTLLVYKLANKLSAKFSPNSTSFVAFFTALLWGVHPMHVESVTWVAERKDVLYTFLFLLSCIQYLYFLENESNRKFLLYSFLFFVLSCLAKGMAVVLPIVLMLFDYWYDKSWFSAKNIIQKLPFFIVALLFGALAVHVQGGGDLGGRLEKMSLDTAISSVFTLGEKICFGFYGFLIYILKLFIPINQHNFYAYPIEPKYNDIQYVTAPIWAIIVLGVAIFSYKRKKEVFFGVMFFFITIVLVLQFLSVGGAILAERYSYLPYFGLIFMLVYWLGNKFSQKMLATVFGIVSVVFIILTYQQTRTYKDTGTLFMNSYEYEKESAVVSENLANYYGKIGEYPKTLQFGEFALSKGIQSYGLLGALGNAYYLSGDYKKSREFFDKAISLTPEYRRSAVYYNRGIMNRASGSYEQAANDFEMAMKLDTTTVHKFLGQKAYSLLLAKKYQESIVDYTKMINMGIAIDTAYNNRAVDRFSLGDREGAISDLRQVLKINPNYADANSNLAKLGLKP